MASCIEAGRRYQLPPRSGHCTWVVTVLRASVTSIEVTVVSGQRRGKTRRFRFPRAQFERCAQEA